MASLFPQNNDLIQTAIDFNQENSCLGKEDIKHFVPDHEIYPSSAKATFSSFPFVVNANFYVPQFHDKVMQEKQQQLQTQFPLLRSDLVSNEVPNMREMFSQMQNKMESHFSPEIQNLIETEGQRTMDGVESLIKEELPEMIRKQISEYVPQPGEVQFHNDPDLSSPPNLESNDFLARLTGGMERIKAMETGQKEIQEEIKRIQDAAHPETKQIEELGKKIETMENSIQLLIGNTHSFPPPSAPTANSLEVKERKKEKEAVRLLVTAVEQMGSKFTKLISELKIGQLALNEKRKQIPRLESPVVPLSFPIAEKFEIASPEQIEELRGAIDQQIAHQAKLLAANQLNLALQQINIMASEEEISKMTSADDFVKAVGELIRNKGPILIEPSVVKDIVVVINKELKKAVLEDETINNLLSFKDRSAEQLAQISACMHADNAKYTEKVIEAANQREVLNKLLEENIIQQQAMIDYVKKVPVPPDVARKIIEETIRSEDKEEDKARREEKDAFSSPLDRETKDSISTINANLQSGISQSEILSSLNARNTEQLKSFSNDLEQSTSRAKLKVGEIEEKTDSLIPKIGDLSSSVERTIALLNDVRRPISDSNETKEQIEHFERSIQERTGTIPRAIDEAILSATGRINNIPLAFEGAISSAVGRLNALPNAFDEAISSATGRINTIPSNIEGSVDSVIQEIKNQVELIPQKIMKNTSEILSSELEEFKKQLSLRDASVNETLEEQNKRVKEHFESISSSLNVIAPQMEEQLIDALATSIKSFNEAAASQEFAICNQAIPLIEAQATELTSLVKRLDSILAPADSMHKSNEELQSQLSSLSKHIEGIVKTQEAISTLTSTIESAEIVTNSVQEALEGVDESLKLLKEGGIRLSTKDLEEIVFPYKQYFNSQAEIVAQQKATLNHFQEANTKLASNYERLAEEHAKLKNTFTDHLSSEADSIKKHTTEETNAIKDVVSSKANEISTKIDNLKKRDTEFTNDIRQLVSGNRALLDQATGTLLPEIYSLKETNVKLAAEMANHYQPQMEELQKSNKRVLDANEKLLATVKEYYETKKKNRLFRKTRSSRVEDDEDDFPDDESTFEERAQRVRYDLRGIKRRMNTNREQGEMEMERLSQQTHKLEGDISRDERAFDRDANKKSNFLNYQQKLERKRQQTLERKRQRQTLQAEQAEQAGLVPSMEAEAEDMEDIQDEGYEHELINRDQIREQISNEIPKLLQNYLAQATAVIPTETAEQIFSRLKQSQDEDLKAFFEKTSTLIKQLKQGLPVSQVNDFVLNQFADASNALQNENEQTRNQIMGTLDQMESELSPEDVNAHRVISQLREDCLASIADDWPTISSSAASGYNSVISAYFPSAIKEGEEVTLENANNLKETMINYLRRQEERTNEELNGLSDSNRAISFSVYSEDNGEQATNIPALLSALAEAKKQDIAFYQEKIQLWSQANESSVQELIKEQIKQKAQHQALFQEYQKQQQILEACNIPEANEALDKILEIALAPDNQTFLFAPSMKPLLSSQGSSMSAQEFIMGRAMSSATRPLMEESEETNDYIRNILNTDFKSLPLFHFYRKKYDTEEAMGDTEKDFRAANELMHELKRGADYQAIEQKTNEYFMSLFSNKKLSFPEKKKQAAKVGLHYPSETNLDPDFQKKVFVFQEKYFEDKDFPDLDTQYLQDHEYALPRIPFLLFEAHQENKVYNKNLRTKFLKLTSEKQYDKAGELMKRKDAPLKMFFAKLKAGMPTLVQNGLHYFNKIAEDMGIKGKLEKKSPNALRLFYENFPSAKGEKPQQQQQAQEQPKPDNSVTRIEPGMSFAEKQYWEAMGKVLDDERKIFEEWWMKLSPKDKAKYNLKFSKYNSEHEMYAHNALQELMASSPGLSSEEATKRLKEQLDIFRETTFGEEEEKEDPALQEEADLYRPRLDFSPHFPSLKIEMEKEGETDDDDDNILPEMILDNTDLKIATVSLEAIKIMGLLNEKLQHQSPEDKKKAKNKFAIGLFNALKNDLTNFFMKKYFKKSMSKRFSSNSKIGITKAFGLLSEAEQKDCLLQVKSQASSIAEKTVFSIRENVKQILLSKESTDNSLLNFMTQTCQKLQTAYTYLEPIVPVKFRDKDFSSTEQSKTGMKRMRTGQSGEYIERKWQEPNEKDFIPQMSVAVVEETKSPVEFLSGHGTNLRGKGISTAKKSIKLDTVKGTFYPFSSSEEWTFSNFKVILYKLRKDFLSSSSELTPQFIHLQELTYNVCTPSYFKLFKTKLMYQAAQFCFLLYNQASEEQKRKLIPYHYCLSYSDMFILMKSSKFQNSFFGRKAISDFFKSIPLYKLFDFIESVMN